MMSGLSEEKKEGGGGGGGWNDGQWQRKRNRGNRN